MVASTPTLDSDPAGSLQVPPGRAGGLTAVRVSLAGLSVLAILVFAVYAAYLASHVEEVITAEPIVAPGQGATSPLGLGQAAPNFKLTNVEGREVALSDFAGRPVWINVWASWCAPCRAEMPDMDTVYREMRANDSSGTGLALLVVSLGEDPGVVRRYLATTKYDLPVLVDPAFAFTERYRVTGLPTHFFIDRQGNIRDLAIGGLKPTAMRSRLAKIL